jgi:two-component system sensor histidine kinase KdpD
LLACFATTLIATPLRPYFDLANIVMLFLLTVVLIAVKFGRRPAVLAAFVSVASFDFFFVPPRFSFVVSDVQYLLTLVVMLAIALITGQMTAGLRYQARVASSREERARALYEGALDRSRLVPLQQVVEAAHDPTAAPSTAEHEDGRFRRELCSGRQRHNRY